MLPGPLYDRSGFPQEVQGKPGENYGESDGEPTDLLSAAYGILRLVEAVLAEPFRAQNVTFVPSIFGLYEVSNRTGKAKMPNRSGPGSKGVSTQVRFESRREEQSMTTS